MCVCVLVCVCVRARVCVHACTWIKSKRHAKDVEVTSYFDCFLLLIFFREVGGIIIFNRNQTVLAIDK